MSTATPTAEQALALTTTEGLIDAVIRLTHLIEHANDITQVGLRAQRSQVRAEILRRTVA
jgi:hypothetical protein